MALADNVAIAALVVALVAGLVALAQVAQQYAGTAGLIRKCDSVVYVVYSIPQISLSSNLWPNMTNISPLYPLPTKSLAPVIQKHNLQPSVGEASWVSFYKVVRNPCVDDLRYQLLEHDADHCPAELPVVPMQVSMRDIIVLAMMSGMRIIDASFSRKLLLMQGNPGSVSSAAHPILGTILHFTPRTVSGNHGVTITGKISPRWIRRLYGDCPVAGADITPFDRYHIEQVDAKWSKRILDYSGRPQHPFGQTESSDRDGQDRQMVLYSRMYSRNYDDSRPLPPPASLGIMGRHDAENVATGGNLDLERRENSPDAYHIVLDTGPHRSVIPWRKPWPKVEVDDIIDLTNSTGVERLRQTRNRGYSSENWQDNGSFVLPDAPEAPSGRRNIATVNPGVHDGIWSFSPIPSSRIILVPTTKRHAVHQVSAVRKLYERIFASNKTHHDEEELLLHPVKSSPHYGWEVSNFFHLDPSSVPLPTDSSRASLSLEDKVPQMAYLPEPMFPPDFLLYGKNISSKEGPYSVGMDRWYAAVLRRKERRQAREKEMEDLNLIKNSKPTYSKFEARQYDKKARHRDPGPSRSKNKHYTPVFFDRNLSDHERPPNDMDGDPTSGRSNELVPYDSSRWVGRDQQSQESNFPRMGIKERSFNRQAYVESGDEDEDSWSSLSSDLSRDISDDYQESHMSGSKRVVNADGNPRLALLKGPFQPKPDSYQNQDAKDPRENYEYESYSAKKIKKAQEAARKYRSRAENPIREREAYLKDAFMREQIRQEHISETQKEAERRQRSRDDQRARRIENRRQEARRGEINAPNSPIDVTWFWVSQMDIIPGYFATVWSRQFSSFVAIGTVAIMLEALLGFTDKDSLQYSWSHKRDVWDWLQAGKCTFPPYARNGRGGVVMSGRYQAVAFEAFEQKFPPLQLLHCYDYQVDRSPRIDDISVLNRQLELMGIDSWLSIVGRTPEITNGPANLLRTAPALVQKLMHEFGWSFEELDFSANEGGLQVIQDITEDLLDALEDESLTEAEQLFILVALLRTAKVALSICLGPDTEIAQGLLSVDMQVHLV